MDLEDDKYYEVVRSDSSYDLEARVNELISTGWMCQGGLEHTVTGSYIICHTYTQAMVKMPENK